MIDSTGEELHTMALSPELHLLPRGPITLVLLSKRALAAIGLVTVVAVGSLSPAVHLEHHFVVLAVTVAVWCSPGIPSE